MPKLDQISVELTIPFVGKISGTWSPDEVERLAAWEIYVELVTRIAVQPLPAATGVLREALSSHYSLFSATRSILRTRGPAVARKRQASDLSLADIALAVLNGALRPFLSRWHPELLAYEGGRPPGMSIVEWERNWSLAPQLRRDLEETRGLLNAYARVLASAADIEPVGLAPI